MAAFGDRRLRTLIDTGLQRAGSDAAGIDELLDLGLLEADDPAESVRRELALVDEAVQRARRDAQAARTLRC